jgi:NhaP-type Na+/H+ or K+/H+ antiporter
MSAPKAKSSAASAAASAPLPSSPSPNPEAQGLAGQPPMQRLRELVDRLLVADVFLVLAGALWFAVAVLLHSRGLEAPLSLFQKLWEPLFTPAIGLLMGAALLSGALGWWQRRGRR